jgi:uncharacterized membrane protein HdeD (DUF308 family)
MDIVHRARLAERGRRGNRDDARLVARRQVRERRRDVSQFQSQSGAAPTAATVAGSPQGWGWTLASGIVLVLAGLFSLAAPLATTVAIAIFFGWIFLIAGIAGIVMGIRTRSRHQRSIDLIYGIASALAGIVLLDQPLIGAIGLTYALAIWLAVRGVVELVAASRTAAGRVRSLLILAGVLNLLFAVLLVVFPLVGAQLFGLVVAISFLVGGVVTILAAIQLRRLA